jgi:branched-chain amino acid transport system ATP-binding protein
LTGLKVALLEIRNLSKNFGGLAAISHFDVEVNESEIHGIIGPNGAGKTTLFNVISGFLPATAGSVVFKDEDITRLPVHSRVKKGIVRSFQLTNLFMELTVYENVYIGYHKNYTAGLMGQFLHTKLAKEERRICAQRTLELLESVGLSSLKDESAKNLPYGYQKALGVCIALATKPSLLMLDEPVAGMNPEETMNIVRLIRKIRDNGIAVLMVEHDMAAVMNLCERISVLNYGMKIAEGSMDEIKENDTVIEAYLGKWEEGSLQCFR